MERHANRENSIPRPPHPSRWARFLGRDILDSVRRQIADLGSQVGDLHDQVHRLARIQFKGSQDAIDAVSRAESRLTERLVGVEAWTQQQTFYQDRERRLVGTLMKWLDSLDTLATEANLADAPWVETWRSELLDALGDFGVEEERVEGQRFDPRTAEALDTVSRTEATRSEEWPAPYTVVRVLQRGFRRGDTILRKARVVTVAEED